jgi:hypothetical protein
MTRAQFLAKFPRATEQVIRLNCSDYLKGGGEKHGTAKAAIAAALIPSDPASGPKRKRKLVERTRNACTWTEAEFWTRIRSCLRRMSIYWRPAREALHAARVPFHGPRGQKWAFLCADCQKLFKRSSVQLDHVNPCGALKSYEDIGAFLERLLPEDPNAYRVRCTKCHQAKTNRERETSRSAPQCARANPPPSAPPPQHGSSAR